MIRAILTSMLVATPALAQTPLTADEFEARVTGKTIHFSQAGERAGSEQYFEGRSVRWQFPDGTCEDGTWYQAGSSICFSYDSAPDMPQCWTFTENDGTLTGQFDAEPEDPPLLANRINRIPLSCVGPDLGA